MGQFFFENWVSYSAGVTCVSKNSLKLLYLAQFSRYKHFCVLKKNLKFKMAAKLGKASLHRYPVDKNFAEIPLVNFYFI